MINASSSLSDILEKLLNFIVLLGVLSRTAVLDLLKVLQQGSQDCFYYALGPVYCLISPQRALGTNYRDSTTQCLAKITLLPGSLGPGYEPIHSMEYQLKS